MNINVFLFKTKNLLLLIAIISFVLFGTSSCKTSHIAKNDTSIIEQNNEKFIHKVIDNNQESKALTAKVKVKVQADGKDMSLSGNLKMMRDNVIQLSLSFFGMEVGRLEFLTDEVVIIDRFHKQYVQVPYSQVDFLNKTKIDFYTLQAIFWNEIFVAGENNTKENLNLFTTSESGDHTLIRMKSAPKLNYDFLAETKTALLKRTTIAPKDMNEPGEFVCRYTNYKKFNNKLFPSDMSLIFNYDGKKFALDLGLSDLDTKSNWPVRTEVSSKYKKVDPRGIINKLLAL